jgi:general nucleoside transport system permease protein
MDVIETAPSPPTPQTRPDEANVASTSWYVRLTPLIVSLGAILLALIIGGIIMGIAVPGCQGSAVCSWHVAGWHIPKHVTVPLNGYWLLVVGAFGTPYDIEETLVASIPLIFAALAVAFSFRGGLFNIGAEGQLYAGAIAATAVGITFSWPTWLLLPACVLVAILAGAGWALVPGILKAYRGAHEVITTMMLNYVALNLMHYTLINSITGAPGPLEGPLPGNPVSRGVNATFPVIVPSSIVPNARLNAAFLLALGCAVIFWFILFKTTLGYAIRATGFNLRAARYAGINVNRTIILTMVISGAFAGLAGVSYVCGVGGQLQDSFDNFTFGFDAIAVALLGRNTAVGSVVAAVLFGALYHGGITMQANANIDTHIISIIQGLIIFFVGAEALVRYIGRRGWSVTQLRNAKPDAEVPAEGAAV